MKIGTFPALHSLKILISNDFISITSLRRTIFFIGISIFLSGCFAFYLPQRSVPAEIENTLKRLPPSLRYSVEITNSDIYLGNQYLLLFPFRRIYLEHPAEFIGASAQVAAALDGLRIQYDERNPDLVLTVEEIELSAFDLLVTRKVVGSITFKASVGLSGPQQRTITFSESDSEYVRYAFSDSLLSVLERVTRKALRKSIIWYGDIRKPSLR